MRLFFTICWRLLAALCLATAFGCTRELRLAKGDEFFAIAEDAVLEVTLRSADLRVDARRFAVDQPFYFSFEKAQGAIFERCQATPVLERALASVYALRVRDLLTSERSEALRKAHGPTSWIELEVRDTIEGGEPFRIWLLKRGAPAGQLYAQLPGDRDVFLLDASLLQLLDLGCSAG